MTIDRLTPLIAALMANPPEPYVRVISRLAEADPDRPSVTCGNETLTRGELERRANKLARAYQARGVKFGDYVTLGLPNSVDFAVALVATWKVGAVPQPISYKLPAIERQAIIDLADSALVHGADPADHPGRVCLPVGFQPEDELSDGPHEELISPALKAPTSGGSTGRPKLIVSGSTATGSSATLEVLFEMTADDVVLAPGPLYHNAPLTILLGAFFLGQHCVLLPKFSAEDCLDAITQNKVTWTQVVPTMMSRMLKAYEAEPDRYDLSSLRALWHMASVCPHWLKQAWIDLIGPEKIFELYGGTEMQAVTIINGKEWLDHRGSVGTPALGEIKILDDNGNVTAAGEVGEIYMRPNPGMPTPYRYIGAEAKVIEDGWETLGDLGWTDEDGYIYISDRRTDMIVSGGANIYPAEVEAALESHPKVGSAVVVGLPHPDLGQAGHAIVQAEGLSVEELLEFLNERLVRYKVPRSVEFVTEQLRDDAGKVRRSELRDQAEARLSKA